MEYTIINKSTELTDAVQFCPPPATGFSLIYDFEIPEEVVSNIEYAGIMCNGAWMYQIRVAEPLFNFEVKIPVTYGALFIHLKLKTPGHIPWLKLRCQPRHVGDTNFDTYVGANIGINREIIVKKDFDPNLPYYETSLLCCGGYHPCRVQLLWLNPTWLDRKPGPKHNHDM